MAASNSTALAEILGIPSSSSSSARPSAVASPVPVISDPALVVVPTTATTTTTTTTTTEAKESLQILTTSSQSVSDYFRAKLGAKTQGERTLAAVGGAAASARDDEDEDDRAGLVFGGKTSRVITPPPDRLDEEPVRRGIGAWSSTSRFATMFMQDQPTTTKARNENTMMASVEPVRLSK